MAAYDVVVEIPKGSRNKYEVDHETGRVYLDRVLFTSFVYPTDYGFFEKTLASTATPWTRWCCSSTRRFPGVGVKVRPVGVFKMSDEAGTDAKVLVVPAKDPRWAHIQDISDVDEQTKAEIAHFFERYKDLEPNKWVKAEGWGDAAEAEAIVRPARPRTCPRSLTLRRTGALSIGGRAPFCRAGRSGAPGAIGRTLARCPGRYARSRLLPRRSRPPGAELQGAAGAGDVGQEVARRPRPPARPRRHPVGPPRSSAIAGVDRVVVAA